MTLLQVCQSVHEMAYVYRHRFGFPVDVVADRPLLITGKHIAALAMPQPLGSVVRNRLIHAGAASVPVITHLKHPRWVFLVGSSQPMIETQPATLAAFGVEALGPAKKVWLPHRDTSVGWRWASEPQPTTAPTDQAAVPACSQVLAVANAVVQL
ncbi:hypothetical protein [Nocardia cyriacigeorgica]